MIVTETKKEQQPTTVFAEKVGKNPATVAKELLRTKQRRKFLLKSSKGHAVSICGKWKYW